jgi:hypothetical protein
VDQKANSDVNSALAALSASPMRYRSFSDTPATPDGSEPANLDAVGFPLLLAALPEVARLSIPRSSTIRGPDPGKPEAHSDISQAPIRNTAIVADATTPVVERDTFPTLERAISPARERDMARVRERDMWAQPSARTQPSERTENFMNRARPSVRIMQSRHVPAQDAPQPNTVASTVAGGQPQRTSLRATFRTLGHADPARDERNELPSNLQDMFRLL